MALVLLFLILFSGVSQADIFVQGAPSNASLSETLSKDREAYYYHSPGIDSRQVEKKVSDLDVLKAGNLTRDKSLYSYDIAFQKEFDDSFLKDPSFDKYRLSQNKLLLLEYASPALADVIKHYRVLTAQRVAIEEQRLADIERGTETRLDGIRMQSERECLREHAGEGLVAAMEKCKQSSQPFDALPLLNGQASLADGRRNIHLVRDALGLLELSEKDIPDKVAALSGEVIISDDSYQEVLPKESFAQRVDFYRQKIAAKWKEILGAAGAGNVQPKSFGELSLPGVPVSAAVITALKVLDMPSREVAVVKLSASLARYKAYEDYDEARMYLTDASLLPSLPAVFVRILRARSGYIDEVLSRTGGKDMMADGYRSMLADVVNDADIFRTRLLTETSREEDETTPASLMMAF